MGQLEPGAGESVGEELRVLAPALGDLAEAGVFAKRQVGSEHDRGMAHVGPVRVGHQVRRSRILGNPLDRAGRALGLDPFEAIEVVEVLGGPGGGSSSPGTFEAARNGVFRMALAALVLPTQALVLDCRLARITDQAAFRLAGAVGLAEGVAAGDQGGGFLVAHRHAAKSAADVAASGKGIELVLESDKGLADHYWGDALRIRQILNNFVDNAIKFTDRGSVIVNAARIGQEGECDLVRFEVRDTGSGLTAEQAGRLFQPFVQADQTLTRTHGGSGLGLSICRQLAVAMGGTIGVNSEPGAGSTFWFQIPLKPLADDMARQARPLQREHVLIVEDQADAQRVLLGYLDGWGFAGDVAVSGRGALDRIIAEAETSNPFTLLILDWKLPDGDGLWLLDELHKAASAGRLNRVPAILMVTAYDRGNLNRAAAQQKLVPDAILSKPITATQLQNVIADLQRKGFTARTGAVPDVDDRPAVERVRPVRGAQLLLVEDNRTNQEVAVAMLTQMGMQVDVAGNGQEALEQLERKDYALVLMDVHMPVMNGLDAARAIRAGKWGAKLPIVALTAAAFPEDRRQVAAAGMNDFLSKPVDPQRLATTLLRWLPESTQQSTLASAKALPVPDAGLPASLENFDLAATLERFSGDGAILARVLAAFADDFRSWPTEARSACASQDFVRLKSLAHALKGGAGGAGAIHCERAARQLDDRLREGPVDEETYRAELELLTERAAAALEAALHELRSRLEVE